MDRAQPARQDSQLHTQLNSPTAPLGALMTGVKIKYFNQDQQMP